MAKFTILLCFPIEILEVFVVKLQSKSKVQTSLIWNRKKVKSYQIFIANNSLEGNTNRSKFNFFAINKTLFLKTQVNPYIYALIPTRDKM